MRHIIILAVILLALQQMAVAQTGQWKLSGNDLTGTEKLGSTNNQSVKFITNNKTRMTLTNAGNLNINSDQNSIQFPVPGTTPKPMMFMFPSGTNNTDRMIIAHSPGSADFGLQYSDATDDFNFLSGGKKILSIGLGSNSVGVNAGFTVAGNASFTGNVIHIGSVGIGTANPSSRLHIFKGNAGITPVTNTTVTTESSGDNFLSLLTPSTSKSAILFGNSSSNQDGAIVFNNPSTPHGMQFNTSTLTRMVLTGQGLLGIATVTPATELHVVHGDGGGFGGINHGIRVQNANGHHWTLYVNSVSGELDLFKDNTVAGFFSSLTGDYISTLNDQFKTVKAADEVLPKLMQLNINKSKTENDNSHYAVAIDDAEKVFPGIVQHYVIDNGKSLAKINYNGVNAITVKAIQEQQAIIDSQRHDIAALKKMVTELAQQVKVLSALQPDNSVAESKSILLTAASLEQNTPNPVTNTTIIRYTLPDKFSSAQIMITDKNGNTIKRMNISAKGKGMLNVNAASLASGSYHYSLVVDGKMIETKQMVVAK